MNFKKYLFLILIATTANFTFSQEGLPVYTDYLTDNYYILHPSMAGAAICDKVRLTGRQQWFGQDNAPQLQTISVNGRFGDSQSGYGAIAFNDKNGFHSQTGAYLTYSHHLLFSRNEVDLNQLSFGLSAGFLQYKLDESTFLAEGFDPIIAGIEQSSTEFNLDFGFSYAFLNYYAHATVKNVLDNSGINNDIQATSNLRRYILSVGGVFNKLGSEWSFEPSTMFQYRDATAESLIDVNMKVYKKTQFGKLWGGMSYRRSLDGAEFRNGNDVTSQKLQYISPLIGINYKKFVFAYTYSYQSNRVVFNNSGFHQITLGINFNCRREPYDCNCPLVN